MQFLFSMKGNYIMLLCLFANILNTLCQKHSNESEVKSLGLHLTKREKFLLSTAWNKIDKPLFSTTVIINVFQYYIKVGQGYPVSRSYSSYMSKQEFLFIDASLFQNYIESAINNDINYELFNNAGKDYAQYRSLQFLRYWLILQEEVRKLIPIYMVGATSELQTAWMKLLSNIWDPVYNAYFEETQTFSKKKPFYKYYENGLKDFKKTD